MFILPHLKGFAAGSVASNTFKSAALDLNFASTKSLTDSISGSNLVTFNRAGPVANAATFVGSDGVLRLAVTNLLLRSEAIATSPWFNSNVTLTNNTSDVLDPVGGSTATKIVATGSSSAFGQPVTLTAAIYAGSIWLRSATGNISAQLIVYLGGAPFTNIGTTSVTITTTWQRFSVITSTATAASYNIQLNNIAAGTVYAWGAQLEQASTVGDYVPTVAAINSAPRFDHNPQTGESLGLLVEEARTNYLLQSQDFTTTWSQVNITTTANTTVSPDGGINADTLLINVAAAATGQTTQSFTAGSTITASVFAKKNASNFIRFELGSLCSCWFNLDTGVTATNNAGSGNVLFSAKSIQSFGSGWYRCSLTVTTTTITTLGVSIFATNADNTTSAVGSSVFLWGAQAEVGAFATSFIPTTTTTTTRAADVAQITGSNFSSFYNQAEGTLFGEGAVPVGSSGARALASFDDNTTTERIQIGHNGSTAMLTIVVDGGTTQFAPTVVGGSFPPGEYRKLAVAVKAADFAAITAPGTVSTGSSGTIPTPTQLQIGFGPARTQPNLPIKRLTYWPTRLANTTLQQITQP